MGDIHSKCCNIFNKSVKIRVIIFLVLKIKNAVSQNLLASTHKIKSSQDNLWAGLVRKRGRPIIGFDGVAHLTQTES